MSNPLEGFATAFKDTPTPVKLGVLGAGAVVVFLYIQHRNSTATSGAGSNGSSNGASYQAPTPTQYTNTGLPSNYPVSGVPDSVYNSPINLSGPVSSTGPVSLNGNPVLSPTTLNYPAQETVRSAGSKQGAIAYDSKYSGVPIRSLAGANGSVSRFAPFGSALSVTGGPVTGTSNFGQRATTGSDLWYPVQGGGYVSAYDLASLNGN